MGMQKGLAKDEDGISETERIASCGNEKYRSRSGKAGIGICAFWAGDPTA